MVLAGYIDGLLNHRWYRKQLAKQGDYREECLAEWQCLQFLNETTPVMALAVDQLPPHARMATCLSLLIFHTQRSIGNDKDLAAGHKRELLKEFGGYLRDASNFFGHPNRREIAGDLLWHMDLLLNEFNQLPPPYRQVIREGINRASHGLCQFLEHDDVNTASEFNLFCHYQDGIVMVTLARLFAATGLESPLLANEEHLSNSLGVFATKAKLLGELRRSAAAGVNRCPRHIWELYVEDGDIKDLLVPKRRMAMTYCVNHLSLDALRHLPDVYFLLSRLEDPQIFKMLALEQLVAVKILMRAYGTDLSKRPLVSETDVATIYANLYGLEDFRMMLADDLQGIRKKISNSDPTSGQMRVLLAKLEMLCSRTRNRSLVTLPWELTIGAGVEIVLLTVLGAYLFHLVMANWMSF